MLLLLNTLLLGLLLLLSLHCRQSLTLYALLLLPSLLLAILTIPFSCHDGSIQDRLFRQALRHGTLETSRINGALGMTYGGEYGFT